MNASLLSKSRTRSFPEAEITNRIREFWTGKSKEEEENPYAPKTKNTLHEVLPEIDSLEIVKFMIQIEEVIDVEVPPKFIQRGGYGSCDEMIGHLVPQLRELYTKKSG